MTPQDATLFLDTPEKALQLFLNAWKRGEWNYMFIACQWTWKSNRPGKAGEDALKGWFGQKQLIEYSDIRRDPESDATGFFHDFLVNVKYKLLGREIEATLKARIITEEAPYRAGILPGSYFGVNPISILREQAITP